MSKSIDSNTWLQEFIPLVNGQTVEWDEVKLNLMKGETCTVGLHYKYSWLIGTDEGFLALECKSGTERGLIFDPPLGQECEMAEGTTSLNWRITSDSSDIGLFELQFALPKYSELSKSPLIPGRLISNWSDGFIPYINGQPVDWPDVKLDLLVGQTRTLRLNYENSDLVGKPDGFLALEYKQGAEGRGLVFDPPLGQPCEMAEGTQSLSWVISSDHADIGGFELQFVLPKFSMASESPSLPSRVIGHDELIFMFDTFLIKPRQSSLRTEPLSSYEVSYPCLGAVHNLQLSLKPDSPLIGRRAKLIWSGEPHDVLGVEITPGLQDVIELDQTGVSWKLDFSKATKQALIYLQLQVLDLEWVSERLPLDLGHNLATATKKQADGSFAYAISATSVHLNKPAPGVVIWVTWSSGEQYIVTGVDGNVIWEHFFTDLRFRVWNRYNSTYVNV
ncbi:hypothetical protein [Pseudomonas sp. S49]|uniref:hypothetical protein n=1 Tax=Pseudomonas sp. S49 TaxID=1573720 RepID=UPI00132F3E1F|nr:hypothetical protein [Pseudomonas sp. S49]QHF52429.1 hypothetical protein PspS49_23340 [Pseudomonas sp. S49]